MQNHIQTYTGSYLQHVEIVHPNASKLIVNIGKWIRTAGVAFKYLSYLLLSLPN